MSQWLMFSAEAQMSEKPFSDGLPEAFRRASGGFFEKSSISEPIFRAENCGNKKIRLSLHPQQGGLAQLARALAWHARGHEFESRILHQSDGNGSPAKYSFAGFYIFESNATKCRQTHITRSLFGVPCVSEKTGTPNKDSMRCITYFTPIDISGRGYSGYKQSASHPAFLSSHGIRNPTRYRSRETMSRLQARTQGTERVHPRE